jgi:hypothetical protein
MTIDPGKLGRAFALTLAKRDGSATPAEIEELDALIGNLHADNASGDDPTYKEWRP